MFKVADVRQDRVDRLQAATNHATQRAIDRSQTCCKNCATRTRKLPLDRPRRNEHRQEQGYCGQYGVTAYPPAHVDTSGLHFGSPLVELISHSIPPYLCWRTLVMLFCSWPANVAVRLRIALSCATRPASCRSIAAIIFCIMACLLISPDPPPPSTPHHHPPPPPSLLAFPPSPPSRCPTTT